jgi:hypothetical protein
MVYSSEEQLSIANGSTIINTPMLWVNAYLQEKIALNANIGVPFFPTSPNALDDLTTSWVTVDNNNYDVVGVKCTYDRMIKMRRSPFPHIKNEQLLYYFFAVEDGVTDKMIAVTETALRWLDREDETAEEINSWSVGKTIAGFTNNFFFHKFKVYQLEETRDIVDFGTARTFGGNKIILDYEYHQMPSLTNA